MGVIGSKAGGHDTTCTGYNIILHESGELAIHATTSLSKNETPTTNRVIKYIVQVQRNLTPNMLLVIYHMHDIYYAVSNSVMLCLLERTQVGHDSRNGTHRLEDTMNPMLSSSCASTLRMVNLVATADGDQSHRSTVCSGIAIMTPNKFTSMSK